MKLAMGRQKTGHMHVKVTEMGMMMVWMQWEGAGMLGFLQLIMERASE